MPARTDSGAGRGVTPPVELIAVDWGSSRLRVTALGAHGEAVDTDSRPDGVLLVARDRQPERLLDVLAPFRSRWPHAPIVAAGMIGSRNGLVETAPVAVPASADAVAAGVAGITVGDVTVHVLPGLVDKSTDPPDLIRGEEAQILGWVAVGQGSSEAVVILPGTHSKWARVTGDTIEHFRTFLTGELYAQVRDMPSLRDARGRREPDGNARAGGLPPTTTVGMTYGGATEGCGASFRSGVDRGLAGPGLLHDLFGARSRLLAEGRGFDVSEYLSGLLIGGEIAEARARGLVPDNGPAVLICGPPLRNRYRAALDQAGVAVDVVDADVFAAGVRDTYRRYCKLEPEERGCLKHSIT